MAGYTESDFKEEFVTDFTPEEGVDITPPNEAEAKEDDDV